MLLALGLGQGIEPAPGQVGGGPDLIQPALQGGYRLSELVGLAAVEALEPLNPAGELALGCSELVGDLPDQPHRRLKLGRLADLAADGRKGSGKVRNLLLLTLDEAQELFNLPAEHPELGPGLLLVKHQAVDVYGRGRFGGHG